MRTNILKVVILDVYCLKLQKIVVRKLIVGSKVILHIPVFQKVDRSDTEEDSRFSLG